MKFRCSKKFWFKCKKADCKKVLTKYFIENTNYIIKNGGQNKETAAAIAAAVSKQNGGQNKKTILMTVITFKKLCVKCNTEKADKVLDYFIDLEEIFIETLLEQKLQEVTQKQIQNTQAQTFSDDQIHHSNDLICHFGDKTNVFYAFLFKYTECLYVKFGITRETRGFYNRIQEHLSEFGEICFFNVLEVSDPNKIENDFKDTSLVSLNKEKVPRKNTIGNHNEVIKLSNTVTSHKIKVLMATIAGDKILDPPPAYIAPIENNNNLLIEKEKTKQIEIQEHTKQQQEKTKQMELELKFMELKMLQSRNLSKTQEPNEIPTSSVNHDKQISIQGKSAAQVTQIAQTTKADIHIKIKEFIECKTIKSKFNCDAITMTDLYKAYIIWLEDVYPDDNVIYSKTFTTNLIETNIVNYNGKISSLKGNSGITNRKFK